MTSKSSRRRAAKRRNQNLQVSQGSVRNVTITSMVDFDKCKIPKGKEAVQLELQLSDLPQHKAVLSPYYEFRIMRTQATLHSMMSANDPGLLAMITYPSHRETMNLRQVISNGGQMASVAVRQYKTNVLGAEQSFRQIKDTATMGYLGFGMMPISQENDKYIGLIEVTQTIQVRGANTP
jgi:hypothetical protein